MPRLFQATSPNGLWQCQFYLAGWHPVHTQSSGRDNDDDDDDDDDDDEDDDDGVDDGVFYYFSQKK